MYLLFDKLFKNYHSVVVALASLNEGRVFWTFPEHDIGNGSLAAWPGGPPDIMPPKFFFAGICEEYCVPRDCTKCCRH